MRERYIPPFIMLLAGAVASIYNIVNKTDVLTALKQLLAVLIIFYIVGLVVKAIYTAAVVRNAKKSADVQTDTNSVTGEKDEETHTDDTQGQDNKEQEKA